jgi:hypothetical protein
MTMVKIVETGYPGEGIISERENDYSREIVTVLSGQNLAANAIIAEISKATASAAAGAANTGDGAMGAITLAAESKPGDYTVTFVDPETNAGVFIVSDPDGIEVGTGDVAVAFVGPINFTLADGATDFAAGDYFTITVAAGSRKVVEYDPAGTDGREVATGMLFDAVDASAADVDGVGLVRDCILKDSELVWKTGMSADDKAAAVVDLDKLGILVR